jgi:phosphate/sulfate permease
VSTLVVVFAIGASLAMAWALGASSNSPPFAPAVGANALSTMRASFLLGILAGIGAITQGGSISETVGEGLITGVQLTPLAATAGLLTAAAFIVTGVRTGYPIPAAFATTSAVVGAGLALGGGPAVDTYLELGAFWAAVPIMSLSIAYATGYLLRRSGLPERTTLPLLGVVVGVVVANMPSAVIPSPGAQGTIAGYVSNSVGVDTPAIAGSYDVVMVVTSLALGLVVAVLLRRSLTRSLDSGVRTFLVGLGSLVAFSSGGSQVGLATGPLESLFASQLQLPGIVLLGLGALGILLGAWMGSPRILQAVAREYSALGVRRSIAALVPAFIIAQTAIILGYPISFNNIILWSIIGSGLTGGTGSISVRKTGFTVGVWLLTLAAAGVVAFVVYRALALIPGAA